MRTQNRSTTSAATASEVMTSRRRNRPPADHDRAAHPPTKSRNTMFDRHPPGPSGRPDASRRSCTSSRRSATVTGSGRAFAGRRPREERLALPGRHTCSFAAAITWTIGRRPVQPARTYHRACPMSPPTVAALRVRDRRRRTCRLHQRWSTSPFADYRGTCPAWRPGRPVATPNIAWRRVGYRRPRYDGLGMSEHPLR